eukprot:14047827-Alexandrium_andersonii.AAC.1
MPEQAGYKECANATLHALLAMCFPSISKDEVPNTLIGKLIHLKWYNVNFMAGAPLDEKAL